MGKVRGESARPRLKEVAEAAGVSVQSVSHVLSGRADARISAPTRERIFAAAERVGYSPNRFAQAIKSGRSNVIAIFLPMDRPTTTYLRMLYAIHQKAKTEGRATMVIGVDRDLAYKGEGSVVCDWPVDGIIAIDCGKAVQAFRQDRRNDRVPVSILAFEEVSNADTVGWDVCGAVKDVTQRMIQAGRKRIVQVTPQWILNEYPREQRRRGYTEAMQEAGLEPVFIGTENESSDSAELAMQQYLSDHEAPEAVLGFLDNLAIGASRTLIRQGLEIPQDVWVCGFSDSPEAADFRVPLSSIRLDVDRLIEQSWTWLSERIEDHTLETRSVVVPMEIIQRDSTAF